MTYFYSSQYLSLKKNITNKKKKGCAQNKKNWLGEIFNFPWSMEDK